MRNERHLLQYFPLFKIYNVERWMIENYLWKERKAGGETDYQRNKSNGTRLSTGNGVKQMEREMASVLNCRLSP